MKKVALFGLGIIFISGCCCKNEEENSDNKSEKLLAALAMFQTAHPYGHELHDITLKEASVLASSYLQSNPNNYEFGGFLNKKTLLKLIDNVCDGHEPGIILYPVIDPNPKKLRLAFKSVKEYNESDPQLSSKDESFYISNNEFTWSTQFPTTIDFVKGKLNNNLLFTDIFSPALNEPDLDLTKVRAWNTEFYKDFEHDYRLGKLVNEGDNKFFYYYFKGTEILYLIKDDECAGISYFFGKDDTENNLGIRIFLVAVDASGKTIVQEGTINNRGTKDFHLILERSWP